VIRRARHNSYRVKRPGDTGTRHHGPPTIRLVNLRPQPVMINLGSDIGPGPAAQRRVSQRGSIMVATQRIHVGMIHARKVVNVAADGNSFQVSLDGGTICVAPRTTTGEIHRYKVHATRGASTR
jgi:hypothetical protein